MQSRAAIRYAKAMYDIANEKNSINEVYKDMNFINELNSDSLDFKNLLSNSQINFQDKKKLILSLIKQSNALTEKLIDLLIHNKRVKIIGDIASSFIQLYNKNNNIKEATIITASPINNELESKILSMINIKDAKSVNLTNVVNPNIIGGFIIRFDGKEYNASVKQNLNNLKTELTN
jgi:F-type H+-transporting ATPase subunit delta|tara:strand:+ start:597 stop:1127 length:531 start_codon:yes stop_codon:yes gene_type:complete